MLWRSSRSAKGVPSGRRRSTRVVVPPRSSTRRPSARSAGSAAGQPTTSGSSRSPGRSSRSRSPCSRRRSRRRSRARAGRRTARESVQARALIQQNFGGLSSSAPIVVVHSSTLTRLARASARRSRRPRRSCAPTPRISTVVPPRPGVSISADGHTALVVARREERPDGDGRRRRRAEGQAARARDGAGLGQPHRRVRHVVGLQRRQPHGDDEVRALLVAGDARDPRARLRLARRRRAAADADDARAARLGRAARAAHARLRDLDLGDELRAHVRARARHRLRALRRPPLPRRLLRLEAVRRATRSRSRWTPPARPSSSPA